MSFVLAKPAIVTIAVALGWLSVGCGGDAAQMTPKEEVERIAMAQLKPDSPGLQEVECPSGVASEVGASVRCVLTGDGAKYGLAVEVTQVDDGRARLSFKVDDAPIAGSVKDDAGVWLSKDDLERDVQDILEKEVGQRPDAVECEDGIKGEVGKSVRCVLTAGSDRLGLTAAVTGVDGDKINLDVSVDDQPMG